MDIAMDTAHHRHPRTVQNRSTGFLAGLTKINVKGKIPKHSGECRTNPAWKPAPPVSTPVSPKPSQNASSPKTELTQKSLMGQFGGRMCVYGLGNIPNELIETIPLNSMVFPIHLLKLY
jgi:hypothetical protein